MNTTFRILFAVLLLTAPAFGQGAGSVEVVPNVAALTNRPPSGIRPVVSLSGYYTNGDFGQERTVRYIPTSTNAVDNGCVFPTSTGTGRWEAADCEGPTLNVLWFGAYGNGTTNDTLRLQAVADRVREGQKLVSPAGYSYLLTNTISIEASGVTVDFGLSELVLAAPGRKSALRMGGPVSVVTNLSIALTTATNTATDAAESFEAGDMVLLYDAHEPVRGYNRGLFAFVDGVSGSTITLDRFPREAFTATNAYVYRPAVSNFVVRNLRVNLGPSANGQGIELVGRNGVVEFCEVVGDGTTNDTSYIGILLQGQNLEARNNRVHGVLDAENASDRSGYGIFLAGDSLRAIGNDLSDCKHCISTSFRKAPSGTLTANFNKVYQRPEWASNIGSNGQYLFTGAIDVHSNVDRFIAEGNDVVIGGKVAFSLRNGNWEVRNNRVFVVDQTVSFSGAQYPIGVSESLIVRGVLEGNDITTPGTDLIVYFSNANDNFLGTHSNLVVRLNTFRGGNLRIYDQASAYGTNAFDGVTISDNSFMAPDGTPLLFAGYGALAGVVVRGNAIWYGVGNGMTFAVPSGGLTTPALVQANLFRRLSGTGSDIAAQLDLGGGTNGGATNINVSDNLHSDTISGSQFNAHSVLAPWDSDDPAPRIVALSDGSLGFGGGSSPDAWLKRRTTKGLWVQDTELISWRSNDTDRVLGAHVNYNYLNSYPFEIKAGGWFSWTDGTNASQLVLGPRSLAERANGILRLSGAFGLTERTAPPTPVTGSVSLWLSNAIAGGLYMTLQGGGVVPLYPPRLGDADMGDITVSGSGATWTIDANSVALGTDTTGDYVATVTGTANEVSASGSGEGAAVTVSLPATVDLGGKTSFEVPNGAAPTVDAFGEIAGDNDAWGSGRGAPVFYDGTASVWLVGTLASDTPTAGQVPKWQTGGTITWEDDTGGTSTNGVTDGDKGDITVSGSGATWTIDANSVALGTDTTEDYVASVTGTANEVSASGSGEGAAVTVSLPATVDLGGKTSFEVPNGAAPTVDAFGEIAGDNDAWGAGRGAPVFYDGTAAVRLVGVLASDTPTAGQVAKWQTGGTITWEDDDSGAGGVADGDKGDITVASSGSVWTIDANSVALGTDTTGDYVATVTGTANEVSASGSGEGAAVTVSLPATVDLGGKTSFEVPNGAAPTVDAFGEIAGDNDAWGAGRGAPVFYDGTASVRLVGTLASDTPTAGQVPKWQTGGTITWEDDDSGAGGVADGDKGDITVASSGSVWTIDANSVALGTDTTGDYVATVTGTANEVSASGSGEGAAVTVSLPATVDLGGKTSFELPNGAAPTVDAFGEIAGDNDAWGSGRGAPVFYDGTASVRLVGTLASDTPTAGQVPKWQTGGTITWEDDTGSASGYLPLTAGLSYPLSGDLHFDQASDARIVMLETGKIEQEWYRAWGIRAYNGLLYIGTSATNDFTWNENWITFDPSQESGATNIITFGNEGYNNKVVFEADVEFNGPVSAPRVVGGRINGWTAPQMTPGTNAATQAQYKVLGDGIPAVEFDGTTSEEISMVGLLGHDPDRGSFVTITFASDDNANTVCWQAQWQLLTLRGIDTNLLSTAATWTSNIPGTARVPTNITFSLNAPTGLVGSTNDASKPYMLRITRLPGSDSSLSNAYVIGVDHRYGQ